LFHYFQVDANGNLQTTGGTAGSVALSNVTAPGAAATFVDANWPVSFTAATTTGSQAAFSTVEATAATGSGDVEDQITTLTTSTAIPLQITQGAAGPSGANAPAVFNISSAGTGGAAAATGGGFVGAPITLNTGAGSAAGATSGTGGAGGGLSLTMGAGGAGSSTTGNGGVGGTFAVTEGAGGAAGGATANGGGTGGGVSWTLGAGGVAAATGTAGNGGAWAFTTGAGGNSGSGASTAGNGGGVTFTLGAPGTVSATGTGGTVGVFSVTGNAPSSTANPTGESAGTNFSVAGIAGGASSAATGTGGVGSNVTIAAGTGGAGTGATAGTGGAGGNITLTTGAGGANSGSGTVGFPGYYLFNGSPITAGTSTTNLPLVQIWPSGAVAPTTWAANGTMLGINMPSGFAGDAIELHANGGGAIFKLGAGGGLTVQGSIGGIAASTFSIQSGLDGNATAAAATLTVRGQGVSGGSTGSIAGAAVTINGGDNASSGATETGGALTLRGGDTTNASAAVQTTGSVTIRGGNNSSTGASTLGTVTITGGTQSGAATNGAGGAVTIQSGLGTGNATGSNLIFKTANIQGSGSTAQTETTALTIDQTQISSFGGLVQDTAARVFMTADWTCGTGGTVSSCVAATIVGSTGTPLTITLPNSAQSWHWHCHVVVTDTTAAPANNWAMITATNGATNVTASYSGYTAAAVPAGGATTDTASTTASITIGGTWTQGATATKMPYDIDAWIEGASASGTVVSLQVIDPTVGDLLTIYRGAYCTVGPF